MAPTTDDSDLSDPTRQQRVSKPWWTMEHVRRLLTDLIAARLTWLRPTLLGLQQSCAPCDASGEIRRGGRLDRDLATLDLDSLELMELATAIEIQFHLHESGLDEALIRQSRLGDWIRIVLRGRERWDQAISFQTSGSTGTPKRSTHRMAALEQEIDYFAERLSDRRRVLCAVPCHHIYGFLFGFMLPAQLGIPVRDVRDSLPSSVLRRAEPGDLIVGHPAFYELATRPDATMREDVIALSSSSPCPNPVWRRLEAIGIGRIIEIYGATETAGIGVRETLDAPFELLPYWSRTAEHPDTICRSIPSAGQLKSEIQDRLLWLDERRFSMLGRRDGAIQIGGINVFPQQVQACLCEHPEVADALVRPSRQESGGRLKAFVVPSAQCQDPQTLAQRLHEWLSERLTAMERPRHIRIGNQLPRSELGKPADWPE